MKRSTWTRGTAVLVGLAGLAFLVGPAAVLLAGGRARPLENRPLAAPPSLDAGWKVFDEASRYVSDHLPVRPAAVRANQRLSQDVFREPPSVAMSVQDGVAYPRVVVGQHGWLFYGNDVQLPCAPVEPVSATVDRMVRLATVLRRAGRDVAVVVVPDKSSIVAAEMPGRYIGRRCATERKAEFWKAFDAADQPDLLDLRPALSAVQADAPGGAYLRSDSHWTPLGALTFSRAVVEHLSPGVWDQSEVKRSGTFTKVGDLGPFVQAERTDAVPGWVADRPGVSAVPGPGIRAGHLSVRLRNTADGPGRLVPGPTAFVGDSFTFTSWHEWRPWFEDVTTYHRANSPRAAVLRAVTTSRTVVLEVVEREAARGTLGVVDDAFVDDVERTLAGQGSSGGGPGQG